jgi:hypothetical protein
MTKQKRYFISAGSGMAIGIGVSFLVEYILSKKGENAYVIANPVGIFVGLLSAGVINNSIEKYEK